MSSTHTGIEVYVHLVVVTGHKSTIASASCMGESEQVVTTIADHKHTLLHNYTAPMTTQAVAAHVVQWTSSVTVGELVRR